MCFLTKLCRLCTNYTDKSLTLMNFDSDNITFLEKLNTISPGIVKPRSDLPYNICASCTNQLNVAYIFIKNCHESQTKLQQYLEEFQSGQIIEKSAECKLEIKSLKSSDSIVQTEKYEEQINAKNQINFEYIQVKSEIGTDYVDEENLETYDTIVKVEQNQESTSTMPEITNSDQTTVLEKRCEICGEYFSNSTKLKVHIWSHTNVKTLQCMICEKILSNRPNLMRHIRIHANDRPYTCEICGKTFTENKHLKSHTRTHTNERPYRCEICNKDFTQSSVLKSHIRTHTNERPHKCDVCDKEFIQSCNLQRHMRTHTQEKPYKCVICNIDFSHNGNLNRHIRRQHP